MNAMVVIQARMGSSRYPGKSMALIEGQPILWHMFRQLAGCRAIDKVVLAVPDTAADDVLADYAASQGWNVFRGDEADVLARYYHAARANGAEALTGVVRLTGDDILPDPDMVDAVALLYRGLRGRIDYVCTNRHGKLPYGAGVELASFRSLERAFADATQPREREHVTPYIREHPDLFPQLEVVPSLAMEGVPLSIDRPEDLERNAALIAEMSRHRSPPFRLADILDATDRLFAAPRGEP